MTVLEGAGPLRTFLSVCIGMYNSNLDLWRSSTPAGAGGALSCLDSPVRVSPGHTARLSHVWLRTIPEPQTDLDKGLFRSLLPTEQSFIFATRLENKLGLKPGRPKGPLLSAC